MELELFNVNFLLTNKNDKHENELTDSFINIYAARIYNLENVWCLRVSPNHHFMEEFKDFIGNYKDIENYDGKGPLLINGIRAVNVLFDKEIPIYIDPSLDYINENVAAFGIYKTPPRIYTDNKTVFDKLNSMELNIVNYGIIKGAEKVVVLVPKPKAK